MAAAKEKSGFNGPVVVLSALAAVLSHEGEPEGRVSVRQGDEIGHPSTIELTWTPGLMSRIR